MPKPAQRDRAASFLLHASVTRAAKCRPTPEMPAVPSATCWFAFQQIGFMGRQVLTQAELIFSFIVHIECLKQSAAE
jgi:hypothetical protein